MLKSLCVSSNCILLLCQCALGPDFETPDSTTLTPERYYAPNQAPLPTADTDNALPNWREVYQDEALQNLITAALENNRELGQTRLRMQQAAAARRIVRSSLYPSLSAEFDFSRELDSRTLSPDSGINNDINTGLISAWELDLWGKNRRSAEAASAELRAAEYALYAQQLSLITQVARTYYELIDTVQREAITLNTIATRQRALYILKLRKEGGIISGIDVSQAEVALAQAQARLPGITSERIALLNVLHLLCDLPQSDIILSTDPTTIAASTLPTHVPSTLLGRRPDIVIAEEKLHAATADIGVAKGALFPSFSLALGAGWESDEMRTLIDPDSRIWGVEINVLQPLFQAGALRAQLSQAELRQQEALLSYEIAVRQAFVEVSDAIQNALSAEDNLEAANRLEHASREYLRLANLQYGNGVLGYLDVLDAQRQLFDAELTRASAITQQRLATSQLYYALGGGW